MNGLETVIENNKTLKKLIDENPKNIKEKVESGDLMLTDKARIYLNKQYLNNVHLHYTINYIVNTGQFKIKSNIMTIEDSHDIIEKNKILRELKIIKHALNVLHKNNTEIIDSISILTKSKRIANILNKKQRHFDIYSAEFRIFYSISKYISKNNIKLKAIYV